MKYIYFILLLTASMLFQIPQTYTFNETKDLSISIIIPKNITIQNLSTGNYYNGLFKITNNGHVSGITDSIDAFVEYNITSNETYFSSNFSIFGINSYKTAGTGSYNFTEAGNYIVCGEIINSTYNDSNFSNNQICGNISANLNITNIINATLNVSLLNISENITLSNYTNFTNTNLTNFVNSTNSTNTTTEFCIINLSISTEKIIFQDEAIIFYNEAEPKPVNFSIDYWVEDLFDNVLKDKTTTSNFNKKQFTPKIDEYDKAMIIKNVLHADCLENESIESERLVIYKNPNPQKYNCPVCKSISSASTSSELIYINNCSSSSSNLGNNGNSKKMTYISSFYTRAKKPEDNANVYSTIYADHDITLLLFKAELINSTSIKNKTLYSYNAKLSPNNNTFFLAIKDSGNLTDVSFLEINSLLEEPETNSTSKSSNQKETLFENTAKPNLTNILSVEAVNKNSKSTSLATGSVVYESQSARALSITPYLIGITVLSIAGIIVWKKL